jgi:acetylornithine deacetylase/succinyl-diaminopimelate desuccinylase-like protein
MERLVASLGVKSEVDVGIKPPRYEAYVMDREEEIIKVFDTIYREVMGRRPLYEYAYGITDANIFAGEGGIPCLHIGPRRGGAHQKNEYVPLDWLPKISEIYTLLAASFLSD